MVEDLEKLKSKVLLFVERQQGFPGRHESIEAWNNNSEYVIVYGEDFQRGIADVGENSDPAYNEFIRSWKQLKGFEWIESHRR